MVLKHSRHCFPKFLLILKFSLMFHQSKIDHFKYHITQTGFMEVSGFLFLVWLIRGDVFLTSHPWLDLILNVREKRVDRTSQKHKFMWNRKYQ